MRTPRLRTSQLIRLAARELWHERALALCAACVVAATLAPLLTLWGLEQGVIGTLINRQNRDPVMRQVLPESTGSHRFDRAWFESVARWPDVAFVMVQLGMGSSYLVTALDLEEGLAHLADAVGAPRTPLS